MKISGRVTAAVLGGVLGISLLGTVPSSPSVAAGETSTAASAAASKAAADVRDVARAAVPRLRWTRCRTGEVAGTKDPRVRCARVPVPLDYDRPRGEKTVLQVTRVRAAKPGRRIGSLFVNPGGPGGAAGGFATVVGPLLGAQVDQRFDIIGVDPRGTGASGRTTCKGEINPANVPGGFPIRPRQVTDLIKQDNSVRRACRQQPSRLMDHASTADNARDMELIRRALGESRISFYGISYGSYLGSTYAAMFPDRIRAMVVDGVLDPVAWSTGARGEATKRPFTFRLGSGQGAYEGLTAAWSECDRAGPRRCPLAPGALDAWKRVLKAAKQGRLQIEGFQISYQDVVGIALSTLYDGAQIKFLARFVADLDAAISAARADTGKVRANEVRHFRKLSNLRDRRIRDGLYSAPAVRAERPFRLDLVFQAVGCSDSRNPNGPRAWEKSARIADRREPWFGRLWTYQSSICAKQGVGDGADSFRGPWRTRTSYPLLVVGNTHDPATPISGARRVNTLFEDSVLLQYDGWAHGALGNGACVTQTMGDYLVARDLPPDGTVCAQPKPLFR